jgi:hypothetical protein
LWAKLSAEIRNTFYRKPRNTWNEARLVAIQQLDDFWDKMEAHNARRAAASPSTPRSQSRPEKEQAVRGGRVTMLKRL